LEELGCGTLLGSQGEAVESQELEQQEGAAEEEGGGGDDDIERGRWGKRQRHLDEAKEINSSNHHLKSNDRGYDTTDEDDEDPQPAKRRKPTHHVLTPPDELAPVENDHHTLRTSRSPSITIQSAPGAEYQEWPFQGVLKHTKVENKTTFQLKFQLLYVPECLHFPALSEALGIHSNKRTSAKAATARNIVVQSKVQPATS